MSEKMTGAHAQELVLLVGGELPETKSRFSSAQFEYDPEPKPGSAQYENHLRNYRAIGKFVAGKSILTLYPRTTEHVVAVMNYCAVHGLKVFPQGGNSGLVGGSVPDESGNGIVLSTRKMDRILGVITASSTSVWVEAGVVIDALNAAAYEHGLFCAIKHGGTGSATAGGSAATNAGGANAVRYGVTRDQVVGLEAVTASGDILHVGGTLKDTSNLVDLKHLLIGSAGSLAFITKVELKLHPIPVTRELALVGLDDYSEVDHFLPAFKRLFGSNIEAFEYMDGRIFELAAEITDGSGSVLSELKGKAGVLLIEVSSGRSNDTQLQEDLFTLLGERNAVLIAMDRGQRELFWRLREHCNPASKQYCNDVGVFFDTCVPVAKVGASLQGNERIMRTLFPTEMEAGLIELFNFGHCADGNIHTHIVQPISVQQDNFNIKDHADRIEEAILGFNVKELGGNPAAEHTIGVKTTRTAFGPELVNKYVKQVVRSLDPTGIMNPGRGY